MKLIYKICLVNVALAFLFALIPAMGEGDYIGWLGIICLAGGLIDAVVALILFAAQKREWARAYLLTTGILFLISFTACSSTLYL